MAAYTPEPIIRSRSVQPATTRTTYQPAPIIRVRLLTRLAREAANYEPAPIIRVRSLPIAPAEVAFYGRSGVRDYYAQSREGLLYASDGWSRVRRWDGLTDDWELAGVPAPDTPPGFTARWDDIGFLAGTWTAYYRYLDRFSNPGNPSPPSTTLTVADISGTILGLSGSGPMTVESPSHGLTSGGREDIPGTTLGSRIAIRWPNGTVEQAAYSIVDDDSFTIDLTSAAHRVVGGEWAQNVSEFHYSFIDLTALTFGSGLTQGVPDGNVITTQEPHGFTAHGVDGESDGYVGLYNDYRGGTDSYQFVVVDATSLALYASPSGEFTASARKLGPVADVGSMFGAEVPESGEGPFEQVPYYPNDTMWDGANWPEGGELPDGVVTVQILRTKNGSGAAAYVDLEMDESDIGGVSRKEDGELGEEVVLIDPFTGDASYSQRFGLPPSDKPFLAAAGGRMIGAGDPVWTRGAVKVTDGSDEVVGIGTNWEGDFTDRLLTVQGGDKSAEILQRTGQVLKLREAYEGVSSEYAIYSISPSYRYRRLVLWSEAGYPEAWYALSSIFLPADAEGGPVTGLASYDNAAIVFTENRMFRFSFSLDPSRDGSVIPAGDRGCVNNLCHARADGYLYALDRRGAYRTTGIGTEDISAAIQNIFAGHDDEFAIDWRWQKHFHVVLDPQNDSVLFIVSLTGGEPRHILAFRMKTNAWEVLEYPVPLTASVVARISERLRVAAGSERGKVLVTDEGFRDGGLSGTLEGTATGSGYDWIEDSTASFSGVENSSVHLVSGDGKGQWRKIVATNGTKLELDTPWKIKPDAGDEYIVGGVGWSWRTGWYPWYRSDRMQPRNVSLIYKPSSADSVIDMRLYADQSDTPKEMGVTRRAVGMSTVKGSPEIAVEVGKVNGYAQFQMDDQRETRADGERRISVELEGVTAGDSHSIYEVEIEGATQ